MKTCIFIIILGFTQLVYCNFQNITENELYPLCLFKLFRRRRALTEYTRWRANQESTQEFIVKILDDDLTTPKVKHIVAVNIQPMTKGLEKIIIGGAMVPPPTPTAITNTQLGEYTRFVPPTTPAITRVGGDLYLSPLTPSGGAADKFLLIQSRGNHAGKHSQRDESPPAGPQFVPRTPLLLARQFAPIAPVAFARRTTIAPVTPPLVNFDNVREPILQPIRTTTTLPTRTKSDLDLPNFQPFAEDEVALDHMLITRTTFDTLNEPQRTIPVEFYLTTTHKFDASDSKDKFYDDEKPENEENTKIGDSDPAYSMMFYNDEESKHIDKRVGKGLDDKYYDKSNEIGETISEIQPVNAGNEITASENTTTTETPVYHDNQERISDNCTSSDTTKDTLEVTNIETETYKTLKEKLRHQRRPICSMQTLRQLSFNSPRTLPEIVTQLKQWAEDSPMVKWVDITEGNLTTMENPIYMMIVDDPSSGQIVSSKQTVMIVAGIQGRDQHAVAAAMYVLHQLIERSEAHSDLLTKYRFWIIPVFNPDGYDYSMTFPHRREWMKNMRQTWDVCKTREFCHSCKTYGIRCTIQPCYGVNLDRNFEYQWIPAEELRAEHPCGELYAGIRQLSEPETRALTHFLHEQRTSLFTFIAFKEGNVLGVMYPYSHTRKKRSFDHVYRQRASRAASAAYSISGRPYVAGQTSEFLPLYAGGIEDWMDGHLGVDNTYTIMMFRATDTYNTKLITERVVHEAYAAMDTLVLQTGGPLGPPVMTVARTTNRDAMTTPPAHLVTFFTIITALCS